MSKRANSILKGKFTKECSRAGGVSDYIYVDDYTCEIDDKNGEFTVKSITVGYACGNNNSKGDILDFAKMKPKDLEDFMPKNLYIDNLESKRGFVMFFNPDTNDFEDGQYALFCKFLANFAPVVQWVFRKNEDFWRAKNRKLVISKS